jgi:hypothetical protein
MTVSCTQLKLRAASLTLKRALAKLHKAVSTPTHVPSTPRSAQRAWRQS